MQQTRSIAGFTVPWGRQEIELAELSFEAGGMPLLRVRIREGKRFTIFDIDSGTAAAWGAAMQEWAGQQAAAPVTQE